jgi:putative ABC transport system ATP-binding protein
MPTPAINLSPTQQKTVIRLESITKTYGTGELQVAALRDISFQVQEGEYCSIMGASGSGKTTLMNIIGCLDRPSSGHYYLDDGDVAGLKDAELAKVRNLKIGFVFQQYHLLPQLTALENVILPMIYAGVPKLERRERGIELLNRVGRDQRLYNRPNQLSGGQQQRVAIARALVNRPVLLLADEPTGALDSKTTDEVMDLFNQLNLSGITIIMVTHNPDVAKFSQRILWVRDGLILNPSLNPQQLDQVIHQT